LSSNSIQNTRFDCLTAITVYINKYPLSPSKLGQGAVQGLVDRLRFCWAGFRTRRNSVNSRCCWLFHLLHLLSPGRHLLLSF